MEERQVGATARVMMTTSGGGSGGEPLVAMDEPQALDTISEVKKEREKRDSSIMNLD